MVWVKFFVSVAVILFAGVKLSKYGDKIAEVTGIGRGFIGVILLGAITSLPELVTTISSVSLVKNVDLAWGNIYGSNLLNLAVLSICDFFISEKDFRKFNRNNFLTGIFSIIIASIGIFGIALKRDFIFFHHVSIFTILILLTYFSGTYLLYLNERRNKNKVVIENVKSFNKNRIILLFCLNAILIVIAGITITYTCDEISKITGLGSSFVGSIFLAVTTSLPEIVVSISSIKLGSVAMAVGNILGSNFFNLSIIGFSDFFYFHGNKSIYLSASHINVILGIILVLLTCIYLTGMIAESKKRIFRLGIDSIIVILGYFITFYFLYHGI